MLWDQFLDLLEERGSRSPVALDIEIRDERLVALGCATEGVSASRVFQEEDTEIIRAECRRVDTLTRNGWLIGHNLDDFDLPHLREILADSSAFTGRVWDTFLVSMLLEPWRTVHALTTSARAHQADADAFATFELFRRQATSLPSILSASSDGHPPSLPEVIRTCGAKLRSRTLKFRNAPEFLTNLSSILGMNRVAAIPEAMLPRCYWVSGVRFAWPEGYVHPKHRSLSADSIAAEMSRGGMDDAAHTLLLEILRNAEAGHIHTLVAMIPRWLREKCQSVLDTCADSRPRNADFRWRICTHESYRRMATPSMRHVAQRALKIHPVLSGLPYPILDPLDTDVERALKGAVEHSVGYFLTRLTEAQCHSLTGDRSLPEGTYWLERHPAWARQSRTWRLWRQPMLDAPLLPSGPPETSACCVCPEWVKEVSGEPVPQDTLWPTSANRRFYWRDLLERFLSLVSSSLGNETFLLLIEQEVERKTVEAVLADWNMSPIGETVAQRLLQMRSDASRRCAVDVLENAAAWRSAAEEMGCSLRIVVEALPLSQWMMSVKSSASFLESEESDVETTRDDGTASEESDLGGDEEAADSPSIDSGHGFETFDRTNARRWSADEVDHCIQRFLPSWLQAHFDAPIPVVMDPRLRLAKSLWRMTETRRVVLLPLSREKEHLFELHRDDFGDVERQNAPTLLARYSQFLQRHWGYPNFKPDTQHPAMEAIVETREHVLVRLPTGEGKSILFQVPALLRGGYSQRLTLVVTPLRALMRDQVIALWKKGFYSSVEYLSGDRDLWEADEVFQGILDNRVKLLYVAPERFRTARFVEAIRRRFRNDGGFEFLVFDEAHCISQWGYDFRPDYLFAFEEAQRLFCSENAPTRMLFCSATVTRATEEQLRTFLESSPLLVRPEGYRHPIQDFIKLMTVRSPAALYGDEGDVKLSLRADDVESVVRKSNPRQSVVLIFVTRRLHAEWLAQLLRHHLDAPFKVGYFHAGMPADERADVYADLKEGRMNVLVATKAFGMGMDIPNIHWCVHLAPPSYLEDYLQEVGRAGRSESQRRDAGLECVECSLIYHEEDFAKNLGLVIRSLVTPNDLTHLWKELLQVADSTPFAERVAVVPVHEFAGLREDKLRKALSWLEREPAKRLVIEGRLPKMLRVLLCRERLVHRAQTGDAAGSVARVLLKLYDAEQNPEEAETFQPTSAESKQTTETSPLETGIWRFVKRFVGFLFRGKKSGSTVSPSASESPSQTPTSSDVTSDESRPNPPTEPKDQKAEIHLNTLFQEAGLESLDALYRALHTLHGERVLVIQRYLTFKRGGNAAASQALWPAVGALVNTLAGRAFDEGRALTHSVLQEVAQDALHASMTLAGQDKKHADTVGRAVIRLANASGIRIRESCDESREVEYRYILPAARQKKALRTLRRYVVLARNLEKLLLRYRDNPVNLSELFRMLGSDGNLREIEIALRLLSALGLYSAGQPLLSSSYILRLRTDTPLCEPEVAGDWSGDAAMYEELAEVNRFAEWRARAMELFTLLPEDSTRRSFINEYFHSRTPDELEALIEKTVKSVEGVKGVGGAIAGILSKARGRAMEEAMARLRDGEEPEQYRVCSFSANRNLLVNAGPGSGKTHVLIHRAAHLIHQQGLRPENILILAFNRITSGILWVRV